ncbi:MAG: hypothetical protein AB7E80_00980 [Hyphomicrobiaceae bacterium]
MSPASTAMLTQVLAGAGVLFVVAYIGNLMSFSNRFVNALVTALVFAAIYAGVFYLLDRGAMPAEVRHMSQDMWIRMIGMSAALVFVLDLVANMLSFSNRAMNALVTAVLFALLFGALMYMSGGMPAHVPA